MKKHLNHDIKERVIKSIMEHGQSVENVSETIGVHRSNIYRWINRFKKTKNIDRIKNPNSGRQPKLSKYNAAKVIKMLLRPATDFGYDSDFWTTRRISQIIKKKIKLDLSIMSVHRMLVKYEQSYKKPETRYYEANIGQQEEWKLKTVPKIKRLIKKRKAILYFEDESNISLTPVTSKTWGPKGEKIIKKISGNKGSVSAISAISSDGRLIFNVHSNGKRYCARDIVHFLSQMLKHHKKRHLVVVMDQAPCHKAKKVREYVKKQKRLHVFYLPPRSPEFNPDEKVWNHLKNQELKFHQAKNANDLKKITKNKLRKMSKNKKQMLGVFRRSEGASFFCRKKSRFNR